MPNEPKLNRRRSNVPKRGDWKPAPGVGWRHGPVPPPPDGLLARSQAAWRTWMTSWVAAFYDPCDLPQLHIVARLYDAVQRGERQRASELRLWLDGYGLTPKGQQDRRWQPPKADEPAPAKDAPAAPSRYAHLRVMDDEKEPA